MAHSSSMRRVAPLLALTVVLALVAAGCLELPGEVGDPAGPKVIVIGDSMVLEAAPQITNQLVGSGYRVTLFGQDRLDTRQALELIDQAVARGPASVVVITTANDATSLQAGRTVEDGARTWFDVRDTLDLAFRKLDGVPCTTWMLIDEHAIWYRLAETGPTVNALVQGVAALRPQQVRLLDWRNMLVTHPEYDKGDQLHTNDLGSQRLAQDIGASVAGCHG